MVMADTAGGQVGQIRCWCILQDPSLNYTELYCWTFHRVNLSPPVGHSIGNLLLTDNPGFIFLFL